MGWPEITMIVMLSMGWVIAAIKHGEPRGPHSLWISSTSLVISLILLHFGGFWE